MLSQEQEQYSGSDSYKFVDRMLNSRGSELLVVSPYIDDYYARALLRASRRRRVRIVTSPDALAHSSFLRSISLQRMKGHAKATAYFALLSTIVLYLKFYYIAVPIVLLALASFTLMLRSRRSTAMQLKVIKDKFVHEKLYISNGTAITGSANLTYRGMHKNIEHVEMIRDAREVSALKRHFEELWHRE